MTNAYISATKYIQQFTDLLANTEVTDKNGNSISLDKGVENSVKLVTDVKLRQAKAMVIGNGGSASIASHVQNDLSKALEVKSLAFIDPPFLTALANDHGYGCVYERPISMWAENNDLLVSISSSGGSENILRATKTASEKGCQVITFSGFKKDNLNPWHLFCRFKKLTTFRFLQGYRRIHVRFFGRC